MKNSKRKTVIYTVAVFITVFVVLLLVSDFLTWGKSPVILRNLVYAQAEDKGRLKKIVERIRKAGLIPREAKYYRIIEE